MWLYVWEGIRVVVLPIFLALIVVIINNRRADKADKEDGQKEAALYLARAKTVLMNSKKLAQAVEKGEKIEDELKALDPDSQEYDTKESDNIDFFSNEFNDISELTLKSYGILSGTQIDKLPLEVYKKCVVSNEFKNHKTDIKRAISELEEAIEAVEQYLKN